MERLPEYLSDPDMIAASLVEQEYLQALGNEDKYKQIITTTTTKSLCTLLNIQTLLQICV